MKIEVSHLGQIQEATVEFGDFTVLVGPQASGKSIFVQLMELLLDSSVIKRTIKRYGYSWDVGTKSLLDIYFGEGMSGVWKSRTKVTMDEREFSLKDIQSSKSRKGEQVFLIPAQRVVTIQQGWPRNFMSYEFLDPYVVKSFSENVRLMMEKGLGTGKGAIFPQEGRMKQVFRESLDNSIFHQGRVELDKRSRAKQRFILKVGHSRLPYMTWSAGQREFMPLLLGLYWLMPSSKTSTKSGIKWVVIEEPEMGLHPKAIKSLLLVFLELMYRGYKVIISTHSPIILELVWLLRNLQELKEEPEILFELFDLPRTPQLRDLFTDILQNKKYRTFFFDRKKSGVKVSDISSLDPFSEDIGLSEWGGLSSFSTRVSELLSKAFTKSGDK